MQDILNSAVIQLGAVGTLLALMFYILLYLLKIEKQFREHLITANAELTQVLRENNKLWRIIINHVKKNKPIIKQ